MKNHILYAFANIAANIILSSSFFSGVALATPVNAQYKIPAKSAKYEAFTLFTLDNAQINHTADGRIEISYDLPDTLVGKRAVHIDMIQSTAEVSGEFEIEGATGHGTCTRLTEPRLSCKVAYTADTSYNAGLFFHLLSKGVDHPFLRTRVAIAFGTDPIGTITVDLP